MPLGMSKGIALVLLLLRVEYRQAMLEGKALFFIVIICIAFYQCVYVCSEGYTCASDPTTPGLVWVMRNAGNVNGPTCKKVCEDALLHTPNVYHACNSSARTFRDAASFAPIASSLGFTCERGACFDGKAPGVGLQLVSIKGNLTRKCYYPEEMTFSCTTHPGNANCFGERYSSICPCTAVPLENACTWSCPNSPATPKFPTNGATATSCIDRINYWRKRACDEGWVECPPAGLPPMTECTGCNRCANSQALYDNKHGGHKSFRRCGERVQGVGFHENCAKVIDSFISERANVSGVMRCQGHCGPIVKHGCQTFSFGHSDGTTSPPSARGTYVLNWRSCNKEVCEGYCNNPTSNECFSTPVSPSPSTYPCMNFTSDSTNTTSVTSDASSALPLLSVWSLL